jgi:hypothetical protein
VGKVRGHVDPDSEFHMKTSRILSLIILTGSLTACDSAEREWNQATSRNSPADYTSFLSKHPDSAHAAEARIRIHALQDQQAATSQTESSSAARAYDEYLRQDLGGLDADDARDKMATAERKAAWDWAQSTDSAAAYEVFLQQYPAGTDADQARLKLTAFGAAEPTPPPRRRPRHSVRGP